MPDIVVPFLEDDDALTAVALESRSTSVESGVNGIMTYGPRAGALNKHHVDTLVIETGVTDNAVLPVSTLFIEGSGSHAYKARYTGFDNNGSVDRVIIGSDEVGGGGYDDANNQLLFNIDVGGGLGIRLGMANSSRIMGILVLMNVEFETFTFDTLTELRCMTCIQFLSGVTWYTIGRTERFMERRVSVGFGGPDTNINQDIPTRCLIVADDLTAEGLNPAIDRVEGVRGMVSVFPASAGVPGNDTVNLGSCQMTIIPLHAEEL